MDNTICPHCGASLNHDASGKIIYLRSYTCGSYGSLGEESEFTQSVACMQRQIIHLQSNLKEANFNRQSSEIGFNTMSRRVAELEVSLQEERDTTEYTLRKLGRTAIEVGRLKDILAKVAVQRNQWRQKATYLLGRLHEARIS